MRTTASRWLASIGLAGLLAAGVAQTARASGARPPPDVARPPALELDVLSYNTHGLRGFVAGDAPETRFPAIGRLINGYDVVMLQEDFAYHESLAAVATHGVRRRGNRQDRNPLADLLAPIVCGDCGAGLSTWVGLRESSLIREHREAFEDYSGWFGARKDAWVTKGLLALRVRLPNGAVVDVYNAHLDAGKKRKRVLDHRTRERQLAQLARAIRSFSGDRALILAGDFNERVDRENPSLDAFVSSLGLRESGVRTDEKRWRPRCDYIFYRDDARTEVALLESGEAEEFADAAGAPLSDHPAIRARLAIRPRR